MNNQSGYLGNPNLRREFRVREFSQAELVEMLNCAQNIEYFAQSYCYIITLDKGKQLIELYDYQKHMLKLMTGDIISDDKYNIVTLAPRQCGKCITGDSMITIYDKLTDKVQELSISEFHEMVKKEVL